MTTYFIGGAPRSGKSTAIQKLIELKPMPAASTDAIRSVAKGLLSPEGNPELFRVERGEFGSEKHVEQMKEAPQTTLEHEIIGSEKTWLSVLDFLSYYEHDEKDVAVEGVAVLPKNISKLESDYRAVFVVNLDDQTDQLLMSKDWLAKYNRDVIRTFAKFNRIQNQYYYDQANKYGLPVVVIENNQFNEGIDSVVARLLA